MKNIILLEYRKNWISTQWVVFFTLFCLTCSLWGQEGKKILQEKDYAQWETIMPNGLSYDGEWVSYGLSKNDSAYKIIVQNVKTGKKFKIDSSYNNNFSAQGKWFCALDLNSILTKIDLKKGKRELISNVKNYTFATFKENMAYLRSNKEVKTDELFIENLESGKVSSFANIISYEFSPNGIYIALIQRGIGNKRIVIFDLAGNLVHNEKEVTADTSQLYWQPDSKGLAFWEENGKNNEIFWWTDISDSTEVKSFYSLEKNVSVSNLYSIPFLFSKDCKRLFFQAEKLEETSKSIDSLPITKVEIWNWKDEFVYPAAQNILNYWSKPSFTIAWNKLGETWAELGTEEASEGIFGDEGQYAYSYSSKESNMASWDMDIPSPIVAYDIEKGFRKNILENNYSLNFTMSPSGRYLTYFLDGNWNVYDIKEDSFTNLTSGLNTSFVDVMSKDIPHSAYGPPIWSENEKEIALYDSLDIWLLSPDGVKAKRITNGKETNRQFRIHLTTRDILLQTKFGSMHDSNSIDLNKGTILTARDIEKGKTGYFTFSKNSGVIPIVFGEALYSNLRMSADGESVVYLMETYENPPKLLFQNLKKGSKKLIYQSNPQHFYYQWGKEELLDYKSPEGDSLKGILYYPANFDPSKKYPTIVVIYENQSKYYHKYHNPTVNDRIGFGISDFTSQGYFVFLPDITYKIGDPGVSAFNCVMAGLDKIFEQPYIDQKKVGLYGHSFGGYESMFILTQTNKFATVVAGAGASNLLSYYLSMAWIWNRPQYTRFERHQWRMGDTYFNSPEAYDRNSPILHAQNISTPFLSWAGKHDSNVNWEQHLEFYLALRKLGKENIMLLYPDEGHDISTPANQVDLTHKIWDWFNFYLKGNPAPRWMTTIN